MWRQLHGEWQASREAPAVGAACSVLWTQLEQHGNVARAVALPAVGMLGLRLAGSTQGVGQRAWVVLPSV